MKPSSPQQGTNSKWIIFSFPKQSQTEIQTKSRINSQHPIQPQYNDECQLDGLDDVQYKASIKIQEPKDQLISPRNNERLLNNDNIIVERQKQLKQDFMFQKNMNCLYLIDSFQFPQSNFFCTITPNGIFYQILQITSFLMNTLTLTLIPLEQLEGVQSFPVIYILGIIIQFIFHLAQLNATHVEIKGNLKSLLLHYIKSNFILDFLLYFSIPLLIYYYNQQCYISLSKQTQTIIQNFDVTNYHIHRYYNNSNKLVKFLTHILNYILTLNLLGCLLLSFIHEIDIFQSTSLSDEYFKSIYSIIELNTHITPESSSSAIGIVGINIIYIFLNAYILIKFYEFIKIDEELKQLQLHSNQTEKLGESIEKKQVLSQIFNNLSLKTLDLLVAKASIENYQENQTVIQENELDDSSVYYLLQGHATILFKNGTELSRLNKSNHFGELSFYTNQRRTATVVCLTYCRLLKLSRSDFLQEATFLEKQTFFQISDQILQKIKMPGQCFCCNSQEHYIHACPQLTYHPEPLQILQKSDSNSSMIITQEGNKQFKRYRQIKTRIPYNILKQIDKCENQELLREDCVASSSISSIEDPPYENEWSKLSPNSLSDKISISPRQSESYKSFGIDQQSQFQLKLNTIVEKEEEMESPPLILCDSQLNLVTKSQGGELRNNDFYEQSKSKAKSYQCIANRKNMGCNLSIQTFQNARRINLPQDFKNIELENENIATELDNSIHNFERMEILEAYFPNYNYENQIDKANQSIQNKLNQHKE